MRETFAYIQSFAGFPSALRAYRRVNDNPQVLFDESAKRLSLDTDTAEAIGRSHLSMQIWDGNGLLTEENVQSTIEFLVKADALPAGTRTSQVVDFSYLNAVLADIGRVPREPARPKSTP